MIGDVTIFLAQIWGPVLVALGIGILLSRNYYVKVYRHLENETLAVLAFSIVAMVAGIVHVQFHNVWNTFPEVVISILGWGTLAKGAVLAIFPKAVDQWGDWVADTKLFAVSAVLCLILGAYLVTIGYL